MIGKSLNIPLIMRTMTMWRYICTYLLLVAGMSTAAGAEVSLELFLGRERVYPGETVPVTVTLRVSDATVRNIGYPRLAAPGGGTVEFLPPSQQPDSSDLSATLYRFAGQISSIKPGTVTVGPARLNYETMETARGSSAFFGEVEPRQQSLVTAPTELTVLPLPVGGRPASFSGAVGTFTLSVTARPTTLTIGDPLTISSTILGAGNLPEIKCPVVTRPDLRSYPVKLERQRDALVCKQVVVPTAAGKLPPVIWSYFDPQQSRYHTLRQVLPEVVASRQPEAAATTVSAAVPQTPLAQTAPRGAWLLVWLAAAIVLAGAAIVGRCFRRKQHHTNRDIPPSPPPSLEQYLSLAENALAEGNVEYFYTLLFVILQCIIGSLCNLTNDGISGIPTSFPSSSPCEKQLHTLFSHCNGVRYGREKVSRSEMEDDLSQLHALLENLPVSLR